MFIGHAAPAFVGKLFLPNTNLGALWVACGLADLLTFTFAVFGIETFRFNKSKVGALPYDFLNPYTHSLAGMMVFGAIYTVAYLAITHSDAKSASTVNRAAVILAIVASHWFLEIPVHRIVLDGVPLLPVSGSRKFGYGLFDYQLLENILELSLFLPAAYAYGQATQYKTQPKQWYERLDYFVGFCVFTQLFVCAAPRFVYENTPDSLMCVNAVLLIASHAFMAYKVDSNRTLVAPPGGKKLD